MSGSSGNDLPAVETTPIPGLVVVRLDLRPDARGWFKENWQRAKFVERGFPDFGPVQQNISFNTVAGTTRGLHAEPWDKYVSVASGRVFGAWVDLREGDTFGTSFHCEIDEATAVYVPRGVANGFQTLVDGTAYSYLVNDHWSPEARGEYSYCNAADEQVAVPWPIPLEQAVLSEADLHHPRLTEVTPLPPRQPLVIGANGQLGRALRAEFPQARFVGRDELDLADAEAVLAWPWHQHPVVINAAADTRVDEAETPEGRRRAWQVNGTAVSLLARMAVRHGFTLVHVSTDYVFDGTASVHSEDEPLSPLSAYGASKAAGDLAAAVAPRHYIVRTGWVIGDGHNFVATMEKLAANGITPSVVDDQVGRLTHTDNLAAGIAHLVRSGAPYGTYNLTDDGGPVTWADVAAAVFVRAGRDPDDITRVDSATFFAGRVAAPRPANSVLALDRIIATGYRPR